VKPAPMGIANAFGQQSPIKHLTPVKTQVAGTHSESFGATKGQRCTANVETDAAAVSARPRCGTDEPSTCSPKTPCRSGDALKCKSASKVVSKNGRLSLAVKERLRKSLSSLARGQHCCATQAPKPLKSVGKSSAQQKEQQTCGGSKCPPVGTNGNKNKSKHRKSPCPSGSASLQAGVDVAGTDILKTSSAKKIQDAHAVRPGQLYHKLPLPAPKRTEDNYEISDKEDSADEDEDRAQLLRSKKIVPAWCLNHTDYRRASAAQSR